MSGQGANDQLASVQPHMIQALQAVDVDQVRRPREPQIHHRHQALAPGNDLVVGAGGEHLQHRPEIGRSRVVELCGFHASPSGIAGLLDCADRSATELATKTRLGQALDAQALDAKKRTGAELRLHLRGKVLVHGRVLDACH